MLLKGVHEGWRQHRDAMNSYHIMYYKYFIVRIKSWYLSSRLIFGNRKIYYILLTHWGRVTHKCVSKLSMLGSDNGLSPDRRQAIIWTNDGLLLIWLLGKNFSEILIEILTFSFKKMCLKMSSGKWRPFCLGLNVLTCPQTEIVRVCWIVSLWNTIVCLYCTMNVMFSDILEPGHHHLVLPKYSNSAKEGKISLCPIEKYLFWLNASLAKINKANLRDLIAATGLVI